MKGLILLTVGSVAILLPAGARGQSSAGAPLLFFASGARSTAMGLTGVADPSDPANTWYNPATVAGRPSVFGRMDYRRLVPDLADDIWVGSAAVGGGVRLSDGPFALAGDLNYGRLDYGESIMTDRFGKPLGTYNSKETYAGVTVAGVWESPRVRASVGVAVKRYTADYAPAEFSTESEPIKGTADIFDAGFIVSTTFAASNWRIQPGIGVAWINGGGEIEYPDGSDPLPTRLNYGWSVRITGPDVAVGSTHVPVAAVVQNFDVMAEQVSGDHQVGIGVEATVLEIIWVRYGSMIDQNDDTAQTTWGAGLALPISSLRVRLDYTNEPRWGDAYRGNIYAATVTWLL
jgi:hypothetical protein